MLTQRKNMFIKDLRAIPQNAKLHIYGVGGRGEEALSILESTRTDVKVLGFLDSFTSGTCRGITVQTFSDYLSHLKYEEDHYILIASGFYASILETLEQVDIIKIFVFIKDVDPPFVACLQVKEVVPTLSMAKHPLLWPPINTQAKKKPPVYWRCVDFSAIYFRPTGLSFCCWLPDLARVAQDIPGALHRLDKLRDQFCIAADQNAHSYCASCPSLLPVKENSIPDQKLKCLHIDTSITCNLSCSYCFVKNSIKNLDYNFTQVLDYIIENDMLTTSFRFDWGGAGEPTLNPDFGPVTDRLISLGGTGLVYSNCVKYSNVVERHIPKSLQVICSLDSGTRSTYKYLRQRDAFSKVWENIARYISAGGAKQFIAKYIMLQENCAQKDLSGFVEACLRAGVENILIAKDFYTKQTTQQIINGMATLNKQCAEAGLHVSFFRTAVCADELNKIQELTKS